MTDRITNASIRLAAVQESERAAQIETALRGAFDEGREIARWMIEREADDLRKAIETRIDSWAANACALADGPPRNWLHRAGDAAARIFGGKA